MASTTTNIKVERRSGRGRCMIATKNINLGELILAVQPVSATLKDEHTDDHCACCFGTSSNNHGGRMSRCASCKTMWYCSKKCQKTDWKDHRAECKAWTSEGAGRMPTPTLRLAGRVLQAMNRSASHDTSAEVRAAVGELVDHNDKRTPEKKQEFMEMSMFIARMCVAGSGKKALSWPSADGRGFLGLVDAAYGVLGKLSCNVFAVVLEVESIIAGCGLYLEASTANHSCSPNATHTFNGRVLSLRCIKPIEKGEEITVGIIELHRDSITRQNSLRASYFFECRCDRCTSEGVSEEDAMLAGYACSDKRCRGVCASRDLGGSQKRSPSAVADGGEESSAVNTLPETTHDPGCLLCSVCGAPANRSAEDAERESQAIQKLLGQAKSFGAVEKPLEEKQVLEEALQRGTNFLHRGNWVLSDIFYELTIASMAAKDIQATGRHARNGLGTHRACYSGLPRSVSWAKHLAIAGKVVMVLGQHAEALPLLEEATSILYFTHGDQHPYYHEARSLLDTARACG